MDDWQRTVNALVKAFDEFVMKIKETGGCSCQNVWITRA